MIRNIFFFLVISFCAFLIAPTSYGCDPLGCLFGGLKQDTLILGEVTSVVNDKGEIKIIFVFPQNQIPSLKTGDSIIVKNFDKSVNLTEKESKLITGGKKYVMSLNKNDNFYVPVWGIYEVTGTTYSDAQLVKNSTADEAALQIFINSGGTKRDFYFIGDKVYLQSENENEDAQIYPKERGILWYGVGIGVLVVAGGLILLLKKKK